MRRIF